jgi:hypothetical protein
MASTKERRRDRTNGSGPPSLGGFAVESPKSRSRLPEITLGLLIVAAFGLASLWWFASVTAKVDVLALSAPVERGQVLKLENLLVVSINTDDVLATIPRNGSGEVVGRIALAALPAGTVVTPSMFAASDALQVGDGVVGLELDAGQIPALRLLPGNTVSVVLTPGQGSTQELRDGGALALSEVLVDSAVVVETAPLGAQGRQYLALSMTEEEARVVSVAASAGRVRLVQVAREN